MKDEIERKPEELRERTKRYALAIIRLYSSLSKEMVSQVLGRQMLRSGTSVGAQYREAIRAKSKADFVSKIEGALQELEETRYWLELLAESSKVEQDSLGHLHRETEELLSILTVIAKKAKVKS